MMMNYKTLKMKFSYFAILVVLFTGRMGCSKTPVEITTRIYNLSIPSEKAQFDQWVAHNVPENPKQDPYNSSKQFYFGERFGNLNCIYEDERFEGYSSCMGEFGGHLFFLEKETRKIHYLPATCVTMIDRVKDKFIITVTLAHMSGSGGVVRLNDPMEWPTISLGSLAQKKFPPFDSRVVEEVIFDTIGLTFNLFYPYKDQSFLVYSAGDGTYLGEIIDSQLVEKKKLLNHSTFSYTSSQNKNIAGIYFHPLDHWSSTYDPETFIEEVQTIEGSIYTKADTLVIGYNSQIIREYKGGG